MSDKAVLTIDGVGEWATTSVGVGRGRHLAEVDAGDLRDVDQDRPRGVLLRLLTTGLGDERRLGERALREGRRPTVDLHDETAIVEAGFGATPLKRVVGADTFTPLAGAATMVRPRMTSTL